MPRKIAKAFPAEMTERPVIVFDSEFLQALCAALPRMPKAKIDDFVSRAHFPIFNYVRGYQQGAPPSLLQQIDDLEVLQKHAHGLLAILVDLNDAAAYALLAYGASADDHQGFQRRSERLMEFVNLLGWLAERAERSLASAAQVAETEKLEDAPKAAEDAPKARHAPRNRSLMDLVATLVDIFEIVFAEPATTTMNGSKGYASESTSPAGILITRAIRRGDDQTSPQQIAFYLGTVLRRRREAA